MLRLAEGSREQVSLEGGVAPGFRVVEGLGFRVQGLGFAGIRHEGCEKYVNLSRSSKASLNAKGSRGPIVEGLPNTPRRLRHPESAGK